MKSDTEARRKACSLSVPAKARRYFEILTYRIVGCFLVHREVYMLGSHFMSVRFSKSVWERVRALVDAGISTSDIVRRIPGITPSQINYRKRKWKKETEYKLNPVYHTESYRAWRRAVLKKDGRSEEHTAQ